jgi:hypothetical protein
MAHLFASLAMRLVCHVSSYPGRVLWFYLERSKPVDEVLQNNLDIVRNRPRIAGYS